MHVTKMDVTKALELQASMDSGFKGYFTEEGGSDKRQRRSLSIHFMFVGTNTLEGRKLIRFVETFITCPAACVKFPWLGNL
jgi:hypothetical protein